MERSITSFFDQMHMGSDCAEKITGALELRMASQPRKEEYTMRQMQNKNRFGWLGAAACLLAVITLGSFVLGRTAPEKTPATTAAEYTAPASEDMPLPYTRRADRSVILTVDRFIDITDRLSPTEPVIYCYETDNGTVAYYALGLSGQEIGWYCAQYSAGDSEGKTSGENLLDEAGAEYIWYTAALEREKEHVMRVQSGQTTDHSCFHKMSETTPFWLQERDGRLYFLGDGREIDISDSFTEEEPFLYTWTDSKGMATCIAVGGTYIPGSFPEGVGWTCMTKDLILEENLAVGYGCWEGGFGHNHCNNETGDYYPWYEKAKEHYCWPWS